MCVCIYIYFFFFFPPQLKLTLLRQELWDHFFFSLLCLPFVSLFSFLSLEWHTWYVYSMFNEWRKNTPCFLCFSFVFSISLFTLFLKINVNYIKNGIFRIIMKHSLFLITVSFCLVEGFLVYFSITSSDLKWIFSSLLFKLFYLGELLNSISVNYYLIIIPQRTHTYICVYRHTITHILWVGMGLLENLQLRDLKTYN